MPDLSFRVSQADAVSHAVTLQLEIANAPESERIESILLRCQIQIEAPRRRYTRSEQHALIDLFGEPERWGQTLRSMLWTNIALEVPGFSGLTSAQLHVPCTFDLDLAPTKYFHGVQGGTVPITLLFSGTVFYRSPGNQLQAGPISWSSEARFYFSVDVWRKAMQEPIEAERAGAAV